MSPRTWATTRPANSPHVPVHLGQRHHLGALVLYDTTNTCVYGPDGKPTAVTGSATTPLGFAGQYTDDESGFIYLRARYYDPVTAQFPSGLFDPAFTSTLAPYSYAGEDPINVLDITGLCPWDSLYCEAAVQPAAHWVYHHASTISAITGSLAIGARFIPVVGQIAGIGLGAISAATGGLAAYQDASKGAWGMVAIDALGGLAGDSAELRISVRFSSGGPRYRRGTLGSLSWTSL